MYKGVIMIEMKCSKVRNAAIKCMCSISRSRAKIAKKLRNDDIKHLTKRMFGRLSLKAAIKKTQKTNYASYIDCKITYGRQFDIAKTLKSMAENSERDTMLVSIKDYNYIIHYI
jgi:hypothetical protein